MRSHFRMAQYVLIAVGTLALGYGALAFLNGLVFQVRENRRFEQKRVQCPAGGNAPPGLGEVLGRLEIPRLAFSVMVLEGVEDAELKRAAGHVPGTALPGRVGNVGIAAHRDTFFRPLKRIQRSDLVILSIAQKDYRYRVASIRVVSPGAIQVLYPTPDESLTLVTCFTFDYIGAAPSRFIVRAERVQD